MSSFLRTLALSAIVGLGAIAAMPAPAAAAGGSIYLGFGHGPSAGFRYDDRGRHHHRGPDRYHGRECSARDAVRKASRMGLRNARVVEAGRSCADGAARSPATACAGGKPPALRLSGFVARAAGVLTNAASAAPASSPLAAFLRCQTIPSDCKKLYCFSSNVALTWTR
jgi:hypothetical protein